MNPLMLTLLGQISPIDSSPPPSPPTAEDDAFDVVSGTGPWSLNLSLNDTFGSDPVWTITDQTGPGTATVDPATGILTVPDAGAGSKIVNGTLTDASGLSDTWTATITIEEEPPSAPTGIVSQYLVGTSVNFTDAINTVDFPAVNGSSFGTWDATPNPLLGTGNSLFKFENNIAHGRLPAGNATHSFIAMTLEIAVQPITTTARGVIACASDTLSTGIGDFSLERQPDGKPRGFIVDQSGTLRFFTASAGVTGHDLTVGAAHLIHLVFDGTDAKLYVNRVLASTITGVTIAWNNSREKFFGVWRDGTSSPFAGAIDQITIWNLALDQTAITARTLPSTVTLPSPPAPSEDEPLWPHTDLRQPLTNDDMAIPGGTVRYATPGGSGTGGSTEGSAGDLQTTLNASASGNTVVCLPGTYDRPGGTSIPGGVTLMAKPGTAAVLSAGVEFAAFQTPSSGLNTVWTLFDAGQHIWRSVSTFTSPNARLCGVWLEDGVAGVHKRPFFSYTYKSLADLQRPVGNSPMPTNYAGPGAYLHTDGRVYIRMQKPHPGKYCTANKWRPYVHPYAYENPTLVTNGRHNYPVTQDPRDYPIFLARRGSASAFTPGAGSTIGSGINSFGYRTTLATSGWSNVTMRRGLHNTYFSFIHASGSTLNGGFFNRVRYTLGSLRHLSSGNDFKFNAYLEEGGSGRPEFINHSSGGITLNLHFLNCTIQGGNDWIVGPDNQTAFAWHHRFKYCTIFDVLEEGIQAYPCTRFSIENCYFLAAGMWGGAQHGTAGIGTPSPPGEMYVHHNIWDCRYLQTEFVGGSADGHGGPMCVPCHLHLNHSQNRSWPVKGWNNTILYGPDTQASQTTAFGSEVGNTTGVAHEIFNNIIVRMDDTRYEVGGFFPIDIPNDTFQFMMRPSSNTRWDYNMWWRDVPGPILNNKWYTIYLAEASYNTLAALFAGTGAEQHGVEAQPQMGAVTNWAATPRAYRPTSAGMSATTQPPSGETWDNAAPTWGTQHFNWDTFVISPWNGALQPGGTTMTVGVQNP